MISYLQKFLPDISRVTEPLRKLELKGNEWNWTRNQEEAFAEVKELICRAPVLRYFDSRKGITLQCDASKSGLGVSLL